MTHMKAWRLTLFALVMAVVSARTAFAGAFITHGNVTLGVWDEGHLNFYTTTGEPPVIDMGVGILLQGVGDGVFPGCLCEGWGVGVTGINGADAFVSGWASVDNGFIGNIAVDSFTNPNSNEAISSVSLTSGADLSVTQHYLGVYADAQGGALFRNQVTITNNSASDTYNDVLYRRVMDWDIQPTGFDEFVTIVGNGAANLQFTNDNGFDFVDPFFDHDMDTPGIQPSGGDLAGCGTNVDFVDCPEGGLPGGAGSGGADHGAHFDFNFGDLLPGQSRTFNLFYGATYNEVSAYAALTAVGAEVFSLGQSNTVGGPELGTPGTWIFAFSEVGGTPLSPVPEPATLLMFGTGLCGVAAAYRRRRKLSASV